MLEKGYFVKLLVLNYTENLRDSSTLKNKDPRYNARLITIQVLCTALRIWQILAKSSCVEKIMCILVVFIEGLENYISL